MHFALLKLFLKLHFALLDLASDDFNFFLILHFALLDCFKAAFCIIRMVLKLHFALLKMQFF